MAAIELITVAGVDALAEHARHRAQFEKTGKFPVLLGSERDFHYWRDRQVDSSSPQEILEEASSVCFPDWFLERRNAELEPNDSDLAAWPAEPPEPMDIGAHLEQESGLPKAQVLIGLVTVDHPADVFTVLPWGGWEDCPWPAEHAAVLRYWFERYGAEVVSMTYDAIECRVTNPPAQREAAIRLAKEQMAYCNGITEGDTLDAATVAAGLITNRLWYFWWS